MQCETVYLNIYECVFDYKKICYDLIFKDISQMRQDSLRFNMIKWEQFLRNMQKVQNHCADDTDFFLSGLTLHDFELTTTCGGPPRRRQRQDVV